MAYTQDPSTHQVLAAGERSAEPADWETIYEPDYPMARAEAEGVGTTYYVHPHADGPAPATPLRYMVSYMPSGPAGLRHVIVATGLTWEAAMDAMRDRVTGELVANDVPLDELRPAPADADEAAANLEGLADGQPDEFGALLREAAGTLRTERRALRAFADAYVDEIAAFYDEKVEAHPALTAAYREALAVLGETPWEK